MAKEAERTIAAVEAALQLLDLFEGAEPLRVADIQSRTGLVRSRILRLLGTLEVCGYVVPAGRAAYALGPKAFRLGWAVRDSYAGMIAVLRPALERAVEASGVTAFFSIPRGRERVVIAKAVPPAGVRYVIEEGQTRQLHVGATGRVLMAHLPETQREEILSGHLPALTASTLTTIDALRAEIAKARETGYAESLGEATSSAFAIAAPVLSAGRLVGALSLAGPIDEFQERRERCLTALRQEVDFLSTRIA